MIYTQFGVAVRIIGRADDGDARVQSIEDEKWIRRIPVSSLKADGGIKEVHEAVEKVEAVS